MSEATQLEVNDIPLEKLDVSDPAIFQHDCWQPFFTRLRKEAPVHYLAESPLGAFWSVSTHALIKQVDTDHSTFSSENGITLLDFDPDENPEELQINSFITMDPPDHDTHRATVAPSVAPSNLRNFEPLIRERAADILDKLPVANLSTGCRKFPSN